MYIVDHTCGPDSVKVNISNFQGMTFSLSVDLWTLDFRLQTWIWDLGLGLGLDNLSSQPLTQTTEPTTGETNTVNEDKAAIKTNNETKDQPTKVEEAMTEQMIKLV